MRGSMIILFFKQKTAYEMRISVWSSDVCSSDLRAARRHRKRARRSRGALAAVVAAAVAARRTMARDARGDGAYRPCRSAQPAAGPREQGMARGAAGAFRKLGKASV